MNKTFEEMNIVKFASDTKYRKQWFTGISFSHPAKMSLPLQLWLIDNFTKEGETILDPMAGSGTLLVACSLGRHVIVLELEQKFVDMMKGNWAKIQERGCQLGYKMGQATILQGDARDLTGILADKCIFSPPYAETGVGDWQTSRAEFQAWVLSELATKGYVEWQGKRYNETEWRAMNHGRIDGRTTKGVHKHPTDGYGQGEGQIGNLPYGEIDKIITSPPYTNRMDGGIRGPRAGMTPYTDESPDSWFTQRDQKNIGNLPYGEIDKIITSPPYAEQDSFSKRQGKTFQYTGHHRTSEAHCVLKPKITGESEGQLGNLPYGSIDAVISSPPYEGIINGTSEGPLVTSRRNKTYKPMPSGYTDKVDAVISSPPYEAQGFKCDENPANVMKREAKRRELFPMRPAVVPGRYGDSTSNIGNLKSDSYLSAMLLVYQNCFAVLKDNGLMVLVVKNFIRNKKQVRLDLDTIKLCEQAGFAFQDRWYRELTSQSFWRTIYHQRYPSVPPIKYEDILVFNKPSGV